MKPHPDATLSFDKKVSRVNVSRLDDGRINIKWVAADGTWFDAVMVDTDALAFANLITKLASS